MFVNQSKKGAGIYNALILFALTVTAVLVTLMLVKLKDDPKDSTAKKFTLALKK